MLKVGNFILTKWINAEYQMNWLRRINRQTKMHFVSDVQRALNNGSGYTYSFMKNCAHKFRVKDDKIIPAKTRLDNTDGEMFVRKIDDFKSLTSKYSYDELFKIDLRTVLNKDDCSYKNLIYEFGTWEKYLTPEEIKNFYTMDRKVQEPYKKLDDDIVNHLTELFNLPCYTIGRYQMERNNVSIIYKEAIFYHMNIFGGNKPIVESVDAYRNRTIVFWVFKDRVIYGIVDGIDSW